jgi:secondary thiamine-phosphate synthase enzyme
MGADPGLLFNLWNLWLRLLFWVFALYPARGGATMDIMIVRKEITTDHRSQMIDITADVEEAVRRAGLGEGLCCVYSPHTTAAITINEGHDPDVVSDTLDYLARIIPQSSGFRHFEGNSDAHIKTALVGPSVTIPFENNVLVLGNWQRIFFCEFDGPRRRTVVLALR